MTVIRGSRSHCEYHTPVSFFGKKDWMLLEPWLTQYLHQCQAAYVVERPLLFCHLKEVLSKQQEQKIHRKSETEAKAALSVLPKKE